MYYLKLKNYKFNFFLYYTRGEEAVFAIQRSPDFLIKLALCCGT